MPLTEPTRVVLAKTYVGVDDPDAAAYIAAVEAADEAASPGVGALETATKVAIHSFVKGCKADGIWPAIKASCILAGARTLSGALVPLAGTAPTNYNFVAGDYSRKTGLVGDGSTKYLDSNRAGNADPQDSHHASVFATTANTGTRWYMGAANNTTGATNIYSVGSTEVQGRNRNATEANPRRNNLTGLIGATRASSTTWILRSAGSNTQYSQSSQVPASANYGIFLSLGYAPAGAHGDGRIAFYSIGESLDLAKLDGRVTDLITAFGAAIP